jgi:hypothetical protein
MAVLIRTVHRHCHCGGIRITAEVAATRRWLREAAWLLRENR